MESVVVKIKNASPHLRVFCRRALSTPAERTRGVELSIDGGDILVSLPTRTAIEDFRHYVGAARRHYRRVDRGDEHIDIVVHSILDQLEQEGGEEIVIDADEYPSPDEPLGVVEASLPA